MSNTNIKPNVLLILNDDMGFSDLGCYGGEIETSNLDNLAQDGLRFTQFYNTARCSPSRASLLTGLHPHQTGIGILTDDTSPEGYIGNLNDQCITIAEVLKNHQYETYMSGKWHVAKSLDEPTDAWPMQRGFNHFFGTIIGAGSYYDPNTLTRGNTNIENEPKDQEDFYYTDAISRQAVKNIHHHAQKQDDTPFFQYVAYTAPHWPLHADEKDIEKYKGVFDQGWDHLREERMQRLKERGIIDSSWKLTDRDPSQPEWESAENKEWLLRCMEVYAAQIDRMDQGIGKIIESLKETEQYENTIIIFLSDNGACAEDIPTNATAEELVDQLRIAKRKTRDGREVKFGNFPSIMPGPEDTYQSYGQAWANMSNTPFRLYKHWTHEGGISTPLIIHWPEGIQKQQQGELRHTPAQLPDIMATIVDITGATYPKYYQGRQVLPLEGQSMAPLFTWDNWTTKALCWEHEGNAAIRIGKWKLVRDYPSDWELYDMDNDRTETKNLAKEYPEKSEELSTIYKEWAERCNVVSREKILQIKREKGQKAFWEDEV